MRILVVDDEPKICHLIEELLKVEGYQIDVSFSGADALEMIKRYIYHLLITDLKMPGIDGLELIQKAKEQNSEIRAIMVTGYATVDIAVQSLRHGVDGFFTKPFNIIEMKKTVYQTLRTHQASLENIELLKNHKQKLSEKVYITSEQLADAN
jgi:DNA-binding NtrC family response regulator